MRLRPHRRGERMVDGDGMPRPCGDPLRPRPPVPSRRAALDDWLLKDDVADPTGRVPRSAATPGGASFPRSEAEVSNQRVGNRISNRDSDFQAQVERFSLGNNGGPENPAPSGRRLGTLVWLISGAVSAYTACSVAVSGELVDAGSISVRTGYPPTGHIVDSAAVAAAGGGCPLPFDVHLAAVPSCIDNYRIDDYLSASVGLLVATS
ncbi:hypothetical protein NL676_015953 [Syzygium grande]|nr:hypothetical protein NL676_015953 [Syzygium grande]